MKNYLVTLGIIGLLAIALAGCNSTPEPTSKAETDAIKAADAKHSADMQNAMKQHSAEAAAQTGSRSDSRR